MITPRLHPVFLQMLKEFLLLLHNIISYNIQSTLLGRKGFFNNLKHMEINMKKYLGEEFI